MSVKLLTEHHLEFLCLTGGCTGSSESTQSLVKMPHCWKEISCCDSNVVSSVELCENLAPVVRVSTSFLLLWMRSGSVKVC